MKKLIIPFLVFSTLMVNAQMLDPSFGTGGKAGPFFTGFIPSRMDKGMLLDANGKILIAGSSGSRFAAIRLNADGSPDNSFGSAGLAVINKPGLAAEAIGLQSDGKIVLVGHKRGGQGEDEADIVVMRLLTDGEPDISFGDNAVEIISFSKDDKAYSVLVQPDDKIVLAGYINQGSNPFDATTADMIVLRRLANGGMDASFSGDGSISLDFASANDEANSLAIDANGKILVGGQARIDAVTNFDFAIARLNSNGTLDNSFSNDGKQTVSITIGNDEITSILLQADGNILLTGAGDFGTSGFKIARLLASDGSLDAGFDADGKKLIDLTATGDNSRCLVVTPAGKILMAGEVFNGSNDDFAIVSLNGDGSTDNGFGTAGTYLLDFNNSYEIGNAMQLQPDGKLLLGNNVSGLQAGVVRLVLPANNCPDADGDGYTTCQGDCDDGNAAVSPGRPEVCNRFDDDCDGLIDNADPSVEGQTEWYEDGDADGFGKATSSIMSCFQPAGYVSNDDDCDDGNAAVNPNAAEVCNGIDDDCDGLTDDADNSTTGQGFWYRDQDNDGYGNPNALNRKCAQPAGYVANDDDCDDSRAAVNPLATEICNGLDDDCDGAVDEGCSTSVNINDVSVSESQGLATLTVSLNAPTTLPVKVNYKTIDGTASSSGRNKDYKGVGNGSVTLAPGQTTATISFVIYGDNISEPTEFFDVQLTKATNATLADDLGVVTIVDGALMARGGMLAESSTGKINLDGLAWPNPSTAAFNLQVTSADKLTHLRIIIRNSTGQPVEQLTAIMGKNIFVGRDLKPGVYMVEIIQGLNRITRKLIKQ